MSRESKRSARYKTLLDKLRQQGALTTEPETFRSDGPTRTATLDEEPPVYGPAPPPPVYGPAPPPEMAMNRPEWTPPQAAPQQVGADMAPTDGSGMSNGGQLAPPTSPMERQMQAYKQSNYNGAMGRIPKLAAMVGNINFRRSLDAEAMKMGAAGASQEEIDWFTSSALMKRAERDQHISPAMYKRERQVDKMSADRSMRGQAMSQAELSTMDRLLPTDNRETQRKVPLEAYGPDGEKVTFYVPQDQQIIAREQLKEAGYSPTQTFDASKPPNENDPRFESVLQEAGNALAQGADYDDLRVRLDEVISNEFDPRLQQTAQMYLQYRRDLNGFMSQVDSGQLGRDKAILQMISSYGPDRASEIREILSAIRTPSEREAAAALLDG